MWRLVSRHAGLRGQASRCSEWASSPLPTGGSHSGIQEFFPPVHRFGAQSAGSVLANALRRKVATSALQQVKAAPTTAKAAASGQVQGILATLKKCCHSYYFLSKTRLRYAARISVPLSTIITFHFMPSTGVTANRLNNAWHEASSLFRSLMKAA